jgi:hypothetical protein
MNIKQFEDDIKDRLVSKLPNTYDIIVMEDSEEEAKRIVNKPQIAVAYWQSDFEIPKSTAEISQENTVVFSCFMTAKRRRSDTGIYVMYDELKRALLGWIPPQCFEPITFRQLQFQQNVDGYFVYQLSMETKSLEVMTHTEPTTVNSTEINFDNPTRLQ